MVRALGELGAEWTLAGEYGLQNIKKIYIDVPNMYNIPEMDILWVEVAGDVINR